VTEPEKDLFELVLQHWNLNDPLEGAGQGGRGVVAKGPKEGVPDLLLQSGALDSPGEGARGRLAPEGGEHAVLDLRRYQRPGQGVHGGIAENWHPSRYLDVQIAPGGSWTDAPSAAAVPPLRLR
jgi:hypothetical protein